MSVELRVTYEEAILLAMNCSTESIDQLDECRDKDEDYEASEGDETRAFLGN